ncbi:hypothetical protein NQ318_005457 [Aromia moschata]|uniref:Transcriptional regulator ATRX n=1 Tax=Aromia moschata TaxID=1265417 RepID=A0AAV8YXW4_9CUCU|nr:hypothetical protein NQ318_005457 [Aromia moschata]
MNGNIMAFSNTLEENFEKCNRNRDSKLFMEVTSNLLEFKKSTVGPNNNFISMPNVTSSHKAVQTDLDTDCIKREVGVEGESKSETQQETTALKKEAEVKDKPKRLALSLQRTRDSPDTDDCWIDSLNRNETALELWNKEYHGEKINAEAYLDLLKREQEKEEDQSNKKTEDCDDDIFVDGCTPNHIKEEHLKEADTAAPSVNSEESVDVENETVAQEADKPPDKVIPAKSYQETDPSVDIFKNPQPCCSKDVIEDREESDNNNSDTELNTTADSDITEPEINSVNICRPDSVDDESNQVGTKSNLDIDTYINPYSVETVKLRSDTDEPSSECSDLEFNMTQVIVDENEKAAEKPNEEASEISSRLPISSAINEIGTKEDTDNDKLTVSEGECKSNLPDETCKLEVTNCEHKQNPEQAPEEERPEVPTEKHNTDFQDLNLADDLIDLDIHSAIGQTEQPKDTSDNDKNVEKTETARNPGGTEPDPNEMDVDGEGNISEPDSMETVIYECQEFAESNSNGSKPTAECGDDLQALQTGGNTREISSSMESEPQTNDDSDITTDKLKEVEPTAQRAETEGSEKVSRSIAVGENKEILGQDCEKENLPKAVDQKSDSQKTDIIGVLDSGVSDTSSKSHDADHVTCENNESEVDISLFDKGGEDLEKVDCDPAAMQTPEGKELMVEPSENANVPVDSSFNLHEPNEADDKCTDSEQNVAQNEDAKANTALQHIESGKNESLCISEEKRECHDDDDDNCSSKSFEFDIRSHLTDIDNRSELKNSDVTEEKKHFKEEMEDEIISDNVTCPNIDVQKPSEDIAEALQQLLSNQGEIEVKEDLKKEDDSGFTEIALNVPDDKKGSPDDAQIDDLKETIEIISDSDDEEVCLDVTMEEIISSGSPAHIECISDQEVAEEKEVEEISSVNLDDLKQDENEVALADELLELLKEVVVSSEPNDRAIPNNAQFESNGTETLKADEIFKMLMQLEDSDTDISDVDASDEDTDLSDIEWLDDSNHNIKLTTEESVENCTAPTNETLFEQYNIRECSVSLERLDIGEDTVVKVTKKIYDSVNRLCDISSLIKKRKFTASLGLRERSKRRRTCKKGSSDAGSDYDSLSDFTDSESEDVREVGTNSPLLTKRLDQKLDDMLASAICNGLKDDTSNETSEYESDDPNKSTKKKKGGISMKMVNIVIAIERPISFLGQYVSLLHCDTTVCTVSVFVYLSYRPGLVSLDFVYASDSREYQTQKLTKEERERKAWKNDPLLRGKLNSDSDNSDSSTTSSEKSRKRRIALKTKYEHDTDFHIISDSTDTDSDTETRHKQNKVLLEEKKVSPIKNNVPVSSDSDSDSEYDSDLEIITKQKTPEKSIPGDEEAPSSSQKGRRNIRALMSDENLTEATLIANQQEHERIQRLEGRSKIKESLSQSFSQLEDEEESLVLDLDVDTGEPIIKVHQGLNKKLKPHQREGIQFMWDSCYESVERIKGHGGSGCILAHCMGLGKTFQVLALIHTLFTYHNLTNTKHVLVVCPLSTVNNWKKEVKIVFKDFPEEKFDVLTIADKREVSKKYEIVKKWQFKKKCVLVLGYEGFETLTNESKLDKGGPDLVICDEGHLLRNKKALKTLALNRIRTKRRIVLTGTPLQNNLMEYYYMVQFVKPNLLGNIKEFKTNFVHPITNGQYEDSTQHDIRLMMKRTHVLHKLLKKSIQRVEDTELKAYLPQIVDYAVFVQLHQVQVELYNRFSEIVKKNSVGTNRKGFLSDFCVFQYIGTHPHLLGIIDNMRNKKIKEKDLITNEHDYDLVRNITGWWKSTVPEDSAEQIAYGHKIMVVQAILEECEKIGDKVALLAELRRTGLGRALPSEGRYDELSNVEKKVDYFRMDGTVTPEYRTTICDLFNDKDNKKIRLLLMSTKVGGLGLNLTAANRVIIMTVNWNPSFDTQSVFRVYRFGQDKEVFVYRLISLDTMEEKVYQRTVTKLAIAHRVVDKHQITRHYKSMDLQELYSCRPTAGIERPTPNVPEDQVLAKLILKLPFIFKYHEHQALLANRPEDNLTEKELNAAWDEFKKLKDEAQNTGPPRPILPQLPKIVPNSNRPTFNDAYSLVQSNAAAAKDNNNAGWLNQYYLPKVPVTSMKNVRPENRQPSTINFRSNLTKNLQALSKKLNMPSSTVVTVVDDEDPALIPIPASASSSTANLDRDPLFIPGQPNTRTNYYNSISRLPTSTSVTPVNNISVRNNQKENIQINRNRLPNASIVIDDDDRDKANSNAHLRSDRKRNGDHLVQMDKKRMLKRIKKQFNITVPPRDDLPESQTSINLDDDDEDDITEITDTMSESSSLSNQVIRNLSLNEISIHKVNKPTNVITLD